MISVFAVADLLVDLARQAEGDDAVALVACYGSYATGRATPRSGLDLFYIPRQGLALSRYKPLEGH